MKYIAAPYTHADKDVIQKRIELVYKTIYFYTLKGEHATSPLFMHEIATRYNIDGSYGFWQKYCLDLLSRCDEMLVLCIDGWETSVGVQAEIKYCEDNDINIIYVKGIK